MPKTKIYACKWCSHKTEKKEEHWQHIRSHLDPKKLLACKSCSFVTEYKHHLEYHYRNHAGVKPYKCDKCDYQCVNMSMLKSHLKSHSPECPYRCSSCRYSTKYAHSLKMHFKKYHLNQNHERLMIDVFLPKTENSNDSPKDNSGSSLPHTSDDIDTNYILDLRIDSKLSANC